MLACPEKVVLTAIRRVVISVLATLGEMALSESASSEIVRLRYAASPTSVTPSEAAPLLAPW